MTAPKSGNFEGLAAITDPETGLPFSGNVIPVARISNFAKEMLKFAPDANTAGSGFNYIFNSPTRERNDRYLGRGDYNIDANNRLMARYWQANHGPYLGNAAGQQGELPPDPRLKEPWSMADDVNTPQGTLVGGSQAGVAARDALARRIDPLRARRLTRHERVTGFRRPCTFLRMLVGVLCRFPSLPQASACNPRGTAIAPPRARRPWSVVRIMQLLNVQRNWSFGTVVMISSGEILQR